MAHADQQAWWSYQARSVAESLAAGIPLGHIELPCALPMSPGEYPVGWFTGAELSYHRFIATQVAVLARTHIAIGRPAFVAGAALGAVARRHLDQRQADRTANPQWRTWQLRNAAVTTHRIWCHVIDGGAPRWLNFDFDVCTAVHAAGWGARWTFTDAAPLALSGLAAPWCAAVAAYYVRAVQPSG